jgi:uncharacterized protein (DUF2252 family)
VVSVARPVVTSALLLALAGVGSACSGGDDDVRAAEVANVITRADEPLLRTRPDLAARKYATMATSTFTFFRGSFPLFLHDSREDATFSASDYDARVFPFSLGDAHPENLGTLLAADGTLGLEANDFDAGDRWPWLWEVRRLAAGSAIAAAESNPADPEARQIACAARLDVARAVARGYVDAVRAFAKGEPPARLVEDEGSAHFADLIERATEDLESRAELAELTIVESGVRRLVRKGIDDDDPEQELVDADPLVIDAIPATLRAWREGLPNVIASGHTIVKDIARELGSGIASRPRARFKVLVEGPTLDLDDDVVLEIKEIGDSFSPGFVEPGVDTDGTTAQRAVTVARIGWGIPEADYLWGSSTLLGLPVQVRAEREAHKTLRVARLEEELGTPDALVDLGAHLGALLARIHARSDERLPGTSGAIADAIGADDAAFVEETAAHAIAAADRTDADRHAFALTLKERGPLLGFVSDPVDALDPEEAALFGVETP